MLPISNGTISNDMGSNEIGSNGAGSNDRGSNYPMIWDPCQKCKTTKALDAFSFSYSEKNSKYQ